VLLTQSFIGKERGLLWRHSKQERGSRQSGGEEMERCEEKIQLCGFTKEKNKHRGFCMNSSD
jgi:hypothetical protein